MFIASQTIVEGSYFIEAILRLIALSFFIFLFAPAKAHGQERGLFYSLGEYLLRKSGHSYEDVEERLQGLEKHCHEIKVIKTTPALVKEQEIMSKPRKAMPVTIEELDLEAGESLGMTVLDLLASGCSGLISQRTEFYRGDPAHNPPIIEESNTEFLSFYYKRLRSNVIMKKIEIASTLNELSVADIFRNRLELDQLIGKSYASYFPSVILGKQTQFGFARTHKNRSGEAQSLEYKYDYTVSEKEDSSLHIQLDASVTTVESKRIESFKLQGNCRSLAQIEAGLPDQLEQLGTEQIEKAVFSP